MRGSNQTPSIRPHVTVAPGSPNGKRGQGRFHQVNGFWRGRFRSPLRPDQPIVAMAASVTATSPSNNTATPTTTIGNGLVSGTSSSASAGLCDLGSLLSNVVTVVSPA